MSNFMYDSFAAALCRKEVDWEDDVFKAVMIDTTLYTASQSSHNYLDDVPLAARIAVTILSGKTVSAKGNLDSDDAVYTPVTGPQCLAQLIYRHTGTESTSHLAFYQDDATMGFPIPPTTSNTVTIPMPAGPYHIFQMIG